MEASDSTKPSLAFRLLGGVKGMRTTLKDLGRAREISAVLGRHGFGALGAMLRRPDKAPSPIDATETIREMARPDRGQRVLRVFEELGPTFIKFGQILSTRHDIVPPDIIEALQELQDAVPPMSWTDAETVLTEALGKAPLDAFQSIETEALASASIAQVHRAILPNGREVVVKIQRPNIIPQIRSDIHILHFVAARLLTIIPELELMDPVGIVQEFDRALSLELDFQHEANHIRRFRENFEDFPGVVIPRVYGDFSTQRVLTMSYIRGYKATEAGPHLHADVEDIAPIMMRIILKMIFEDGYFHGDLHPGNVLIQPDGTIGLIDFGLVGKLTERQRHNILDILIGISRKDYALIARVFYDIGIKMPGQRYNYQRFEDDVVALMETHIGDKNISDIDVGSFFSDIVRGAIDHRIKMPPTYTMVFKALMTVEGMGKSLAPDINFVEEATPFVRDMLLERYSPTRLLREGVTLASTISHFLRDVPATAAQVLEDTARGALTLRVHSPELSKMRRAQQDDVRLLSSALMTIGFAAIATFSWELGAHRIFGMSPVALIFYTLAILFGIMHLWRIVRGRV